jgi:hypothetical protein
MFSSHQLYLVEYLFAIYLFITTPTYTQYKHSPCTQHVPIDSPNHTHTHTHTQYADTSTHEYIHPTLTRPTLMERARQLQVIHEHGQTEEIITADLSFFLAPRLSRVAKDLRQQRLRVSDSRCNLSQTTPNLCSCVMIT